MYTVLMKKIFLTGFNDNWRHADTGYTIYYSRTTIFADKFGHNAGIFT